MKLRTLSTTAALCAACLIIAPIHAQAVDPCTVYMCMAGISGAGATAAQACIPSLTYWHTAWPSTAPTSTRRPVPQAKEDTVTCPGAITATNAAVLGAIIAEWGSVP